MDEIVVMKDVVRTDSRLVRVELSRGQCRGAAGVGGEKSMHIDCLFSSLQPPCTPREMAVQ